MDLHKRMDIALFVRDEWAHFPDFAEAGMRFLGFPITWMQTDISEYMQDGPRLRMVMAQRGEAKSTLAALYAVWRIIQNPQTIVLVVSGGEQQASEVANLIIRLIQTWDILEYLRPDTRAGDRNSRVEFDVHWGLKGIDKSPSVACVGITSTLQGKRAHVLIPDDVETTKNALTSTQRGQLLRLTQEFTSINTNGDILYLGTPQSKDSIYNTLERRGFDIRIWPGRFPTQEEVARYGSRLAPSLVERIRRDPTLQTGGGLDGTRGKPTDPDRFNDAALIEKELDQGPEGFQLQYMLDTSLMDAARQQLKLQDLLVANFDMDMLPEVMVYQAAPQHEFPLPAGFPVRAVKMYHPVTMTNAIFKPRGNTIMFVDPAGGGSDELAFAVATALGPYVHILDVAGLLGGLTPENGTLLLDVAVELGVSLIRVESNMGHGLFETHLQGILEARRVKDPKHPLIGIEGEYSTGQKERRIIDSLVGGLQRHKIIVHQRVFESDAKYCAQRPQDRREQYSLFYQMANITTDRNSLPRDDRVEAVAGAVRYFKDVFSLDEAKDSLARQEAEVRAFLSNPMGYNDPGFQRNLNKAKGISALLGRRRGV